MYHYCSIYCFIILSFHARSLPGLSTMKLFFCAYSFSLSCLKTPAWNCMLYSELRCVSLRKKTTTIWGTNILRRRRGWAAGYGAGGGGCIYAVNAVSIFWYVEGLVHGQRERAIVQRVDDEMSPAWQRRRKTSWRNTAETVHSVNLEHSVTNIWNSRWRSDAVWISRIRMWKKTRADFEDVSAPNLWAPTLSENPIRRGIWS